MKNIIHYHLNAVKNAASKNPDPNKWLDYVGSVYEAAYNQKRIALSEADINDGFKVAAKGPYGTKGHIRPNGFNHDQKMQLVYYSNRITLSEFDSFEIKPGHIRFYECTISGLESSLRSHLRSCLRKLRLLRTLFPNHKSECIIVSHNSNTLHYFKQKKFKTEYFTIDNLDLASIARHNAPKSLPLRRGMIGIKELSRLANRFDYMHYFEKVTLTFAKQNSFEPIKEEITQKGSFIERLFWGILPTKYVDLPHIQEAADECAVAIKFNSPTTMELRYYYTDKISGASYHITQQKRTKLNVYKSSFHEYKRIKRELSLKGPEEFKQLLIEMDRWSQYLQTIHKNPALLNAF